MDVHWKSGDLALCIKHSRWRDRTTGEFVDYGPRAGSIHVVRAVGRTDFPDAGIATTLLFAEWGGDQFAAYRFVRLDPGENTESQSTSLEAVPIAIGVDD